MTVVISGAGLVTAYGTGTDRYWQGLTTGETALHPARRFDTGERTEGIVGECLTHPSARAALAAPALAEALSEARLDHLPERTLVITVGQSPAAAGQDEPLATFSGLDPTLLPGLPEHAEHMSVSHACASVAFAVMLGRDRLAAGMTDAVVITGASVLNRCEYLGMAVVGALSPTGARPFDATRDGTCLGEGAGALILERRKTAETRGVRPPVAVAGGDCRISGEAAAAADPVTIRACMASALASAGRRTVDYVHAHATATGQGDTVEAAALGDLGTELGWRSVPVSSHKGAVGHLMHASGFPAIVAAMRSLSTSHVPGTPGLTAPIPTEPSIRLYASGTPYRVESVMVNSFGFGGNTASLVLAGTGRR
jgi:3-oxoacyl-[acyl-carrier-protein] synthase II